MNKLLLFLFSGKIVINTFFYLWSSGSRTHHLVLVQGSRGAPAWGIGRRGMALGAMRACSWGQARGSTVATTVTHSAREVAAAMAVVQFAGDKREDKENSQRVADS
jgi:hypothetical protein